jgi:peroxiredoxin
MSDDDLPVVKIALVMGLLLLAACMPGCTSAFYNRKVEKKVGETAHNFTVVDIDGNNFTLNEKKGSVVVLDFMAIYCGPCKDQNEHLIKVHRDYPEVVMLTVSTDSDDSNKDLWDYRSEQGITWPIARDNDGELKDAYEVNAIPTIYVINKDSVITYANVGVVSDDVLRDEVKRIL